MSVSEPNHDDTANERRRSDRLPIFYDLRVIDLEQGVLIGDVIDLSQDGMRIMGENPFPVGATRRVQLDIIMSEGPPQVVCFDAQCVWSRYVEHLAHYESGCANTLAPSAAACIAQLIEQLQSMDASSI